MKNLLFFFSFGLLSFCFKPEISEQTLQVQGWCTNKQLGLDTNMHTYVLVPKTEKERIYGYFTDFKADGSFHSYYRAKCGNDCFVSTFGTYSLVQENGLLQVKIEKITSEGECKKDDEYPQNRHLTFKINTTETGLELVLVD